uniref:Hemolymph protease 1 n=1 Tax=Nilaparvata lugens TaxID=108931 RepID=A0A068F598_NILLU|nr:hemolymph protease 1 [Nilaparvata lugens]
MEQRVYCSTILLILYISISLVEGELSSISENSSSGKLSVGHRAAVKCAEYSKLAKTENNECNSNILDPSNYKNRKWNYTAKVGEFPHMVILSEKEDGYRCAGTLVSERFVLSVAQCAKLFMDNATVWARIGVVERYQPNKPQAVAIKIRRSFIHPNFTADPLANDVSLLELERECQFDDLKRPACLNTETDVSNSSLFVSGYGIKHTLIERASPVLLKTRIELKNKINSTTLEEIPDGPMFLAAGSVQGMKAPCVGDAGAPLAMAANCNHKVVGLASSGRIGSEVLCARYPSDYARVSNYIEWIENIVWPNPTN